MGLLQKPTGGLLAPGHGLLGRSGGSNSPTSTISTAGQAIGLLLALTKVS